MTLILVDRQPDDGGLIRGKLRYSLEKCLLGPDPTQWGDPVALPGTSLARNQSPRELKLLDRAVVEIPVTDGTTMIGLLAADWKGSADDLSSNDRIALQLVGATLGARYRRDVTARFARLTPSDPQDPNWLRNVTEALRDALRAGAACVFHYNWIDGTLTKLDNSVSVAPVFRRETVRQFPESYSIGECLTGSAWIHERDRYNPSFPELAKDYVNEESKRWHERLFDSPVMTVLYERLGDRDAQYLLRLINRCDSPALPFFTERDLLQEACSRISDELDSIRGIEVLQAIERLGADVSGPLTGTELRDAITRALCVLKVEAWAIVGTTPNGEIATIQARGISVPQASERGLPIWPDVIGELMTDLPIGPDTGSVVDEGIVLVPLVGQRSLVTDSLFITATKDRYFTHLLCSTVVLDEGALVLIIPVRREAGGRFPAAQHATEIRTSVPLTLAAVRLVTDLVARVTVNRRFDLARSSGLNVVRYLQHEFGSALLELSREAAAALSRAANTLTSVTEDEPIPHSAVWTMRRTRDQLIATRSAAARVFELTNFVVGEDDVLQLQLSKLDLHRVVSHAITDLGFRFPEALRQIYDIPRFVVEVDEENIRSVGSIVADGTRLTQALVALLDNAAKYSITRRPPNPCSIVIRARRDTSNVYLSVENWGLPIPKNRVESIFAPFTRGALVHRRRAIPGLGLGLFLARQIALAHKGGLELRESSPTLDDPDRRDREGFGTRFELWLSARLTVGVVNWSPGPDAATSVSTHA